jgi:hypothetical protein
MGTIKGRPDVKEIVHSVWEFRNHLGSEGASRERPR